MTTINNSQDVLDTRDILAYIEELEETEERDEDEQHELDTLNALIAEVSDYAGDKPEDGVGLVRDSYFTQYVQELVEDCGDLPKDISWWIVIDWSETARNVQQDYTSVEYDGVTYWFR